MKNICIFLLCVLFCNSINANIWQEHWIKAVEYCDQKNYNAASEMFDSAINYMEKEEDTNHPYVYVDRARLNLLLERNELAIADLDKALINDKITQKEKSRATISRMIARSRLGMNQGVLEDLKLFAETSENKPIIEKTKEYIIIRNVPNCSCYRNLMINYFVDSGICESKKNIQMLNSGIWLIKRKMEDGCCNEWQEKLQSGISFKAPSLILEANTHPQEQEDSCRAWCDRMAIAGAAWCGKVFKRIDCQIACGWAVYEIQKGCYWCCGGDGFYKRCIKPFESIADYIQAPCDPMWD